MYEERGRNRMLFISANFNPKPIPMTGELFLLQQPVDVNFFIPPLKTDVKK
jgi:hypothetical protein